MPSQEVGDECHYLFHCVYFKDQREKFIPQDMLTQPYTVALSNLFEGENLIVVCSFHQKYHVIFQISQEPKDK